MYKTLVFTDGGIQQGTSCGGSLIVKFSDLDNYYIDFAKVKICAESTNNEGELFGIYMALQALKPNNNEPYIIYSDSEYSVKSLTNWIIDWVKTYKETKRNSLIIPQMLTKSKSEVKNCKLLCMIINHIVQNNLKVRFKNVKGHSNKSNSSDVEYQMNYYNKTNIDSITMEEAKFICDFNDRVDKLCTYYIDNYRNGDYDDIEDTTFESQDYDFLTSIDIRRSKDFEDSRYYKKYLLNSAIVQKYKELIGYGTDYKK